MLFKQLSWSARLCRWEWCWKKGNGNYSFILLVGGVVPWIKRYRVNSPSLQRQMQRPSDTHPIFSVPNRRGPRARQQAGTYAFPYPPSSYTKLPPGLRRHLTVSNTPPGSALHQCSVAEVKTLSNDPFKPSGRLPGL